MADGGASDATRWDVACKVFDEELRGVGAAIRAVACSDRHVVTSSSRPVVKVWQAAEDRVAQLQRLSIVDSHGAVGASCVEVSGEGNGQLAAVSYDDGGIGLWDLRSGQRAMELETDVHAASRARFLPGGRRLVAGGSTGSLLFFELRAGGRLEEEVGARSSESSLKRAKDLPSQRPVKRRRLELNGAGGNGSQHASPIYSLAVSPDGSMLGCGRQSGAVSVMRLATRDWASDVRAHVSAADGAPAAVRALSFDAGSRLAMSGGDDRHVCLFDASAWSRRRSGEARRCAQLERFSAHRGWVTSLSACPDPGRRVAVTTSWDGSVKLWDYCTHSLLQTYREHTEGVFGSAFAPSDGGFFVTVGVDAQIVLYAAQHMPSRALRPQVTGAPDTGTAA